MGISAIDKLINIEKISLSSSLKFGDKKNYNVNISGDLIINQAYSGTVSEYNSDKIVQKSQELLNTDKPNTVFDKNIGITLSPYIGVVKSYGFSGTRIHLEFAITSNYDFNQVIKGAFVNLGKGKLHFKLFFRITEEGFRQPDLITRFPILIGKKGSIRASIEFENYEISLIEKAILDGELVLLIGEEKIVMKKFVFEVNDAMVNTLNQLQKMVDESKSPVVFDAMIKS